MKPYYLALLLMLCAMNSAFAQKSKSKNKQHQIVFQLTSADTTAHKMLLKQLGNIGKVAPKTKIEVVCHGPGIAILMKEKSIVKQKISEIAGKDVQFVACEFSLQERKVDKSELIPEAGTVPAGIIEIVSKQEQGWSYIKAGQ